MFSKTTLLSLLAAAVPFTAAAHVTDETHPQAAYADLDYEPPGISFKINSENPAIQQMQPTFKFGGYIMEKYSYSDRSGQATNGGFDTRFVRLYMDGKVYQDFYYKLQMEVNGQPGVDKGPRIVDAFVEWQKYDCFRVKLGQFKRSFGFENPYSPLNVGLGSYSQATMKLASIGDRIGEHKSSGRDVGVQVQGDLFPAADGHKWLHYQIGFFNGQGINHTDKDHHKDLIGGLWFSPVKNLAIGGFGWNGKYTNESYTNPATQLRSAKRVRWGVGMKYEDKWTVRGEYMSSVGGVTTDATRSDRSDAWYATVGVPVAPKVKVYARYDCYRDTKQWSSLVANYGLSGNYYLTKNLIFQLNYTFTDDRTARRAATPTDSRYNTVDVQVTARF
ncbi:MAG: porin [Alloprevotella sp.]|nr:porin [Alloprevotella sp.]